MDELINRLSRYSKQCLAERLDEDFAEAVEEAKKQLVKLTCFNAMHQEGVAMMAAELKAAKNELCLHCGRYKKAYLGQCDGCRWRKI